MEKRDLKADLKLCKNAPPIREADGDWMIDDGEFEFYNNALEGWPHAIERAIRAEAVLRELVVTTDSLLDWWLSGYICKDCPNPSGPASTCISEYCDLLDDYRQASGISAKAKEVLGDGDHQCQDG